MVTTSTRQTLVVTTLHRPNLNGNDTIFSLVLISVYLVWHVLDYALELEKDMILP